MNNQNNEDYETINLVGINLHKLTKKQLLKEIMRLAQKDKAIISYANIKTMNLALEQGWYADFLNNSELVYCDGFGVVLGARLAGLSIRSWHRSTCPDWLDELAGECVQNGRSLFLLAGNQQTIDIATQRLNSKFPDLRLKIHHGYFEKNGATNEQVVEMINSFQPDILCVGFGTPLQEKWIQQNFDRIDTHLFLPIGACVDYYTGIRSRGPAWLTDHGFEWLCRLISEPGRLWHRYIIGNPLFIFRVIKARLNSRKSTSLSINSTAQKHHVQPRTRSNPKQDH